MNAGSTFIPDFIKARNPEGLRRLMFERNIKDGKQYIYQNPQYVVDKKTGVGWWYAWFFRDLLSDANADLKNILSATLEQTGGNG